MQAIITKYIPATNTKGSRIKASCERGSVTISYDSEHDEQGAHREAVATLIRKFVNEDAKRYETTKERNPWARPFVTGQIPSGQYVHVFTS